MTKAIQKGLEENDKTLRSKVDKEGTNEKNGHTENNSLKEQKKRSQKRRS